MSYTISTDVFCDQCNDWTSGTTGNQIMKRKALRMALKRGWTKELGKVLCPRCNGKSDYKLSDGSYNFKDPK